ncbi:hypothetical protein BDV33DRAFT_24359 [Aspergillus novoparasiticus]|uniref:Cytochrome P450 n=1 Tax=Aspergillus novoparasiticus TaxID=986946 RepID=A0A5N6F541_9EURO|nr:hypothetical protein BDV33DRAFT_24359 [Aspergillus novoparasiticus]
MSTAPEHLPFGHGGHSCPSRLLVDFELKMIVVYLLRSRISGRIKWTETCESVDGPGSNAAFSGAS